MQQLPDGACVTDAKFLPIIAAYVNKLSIVETVNRMCPTEACDVSTGHMAAAMILDTLSGRSPLYLLERAFEHLDIELLLGIPISAEKLNDDAAARALDRISRADTGKIFGAVALTAAKLFNVNTRHVSQDTTICTKSPQMTIPSRSLMVSASKNDPTSSNWYTVCSAWTTASPST
jgi:hypothetical protein